MRISQGTLYLMETLNIVSVTATKKKKSQKLSRSVALELKINNIVPALWNMCGNRDKLRQNICVTG